MFRRSVLDNLVGDCVSLPDVDLLRLVFLPARARILAFLITAATVELSDKDTSMVHLHSSGMSLSRSLACFASSMNGPVLPRIVCQ